MIELDCRDTAPLSGIKLIPSVKPACIQLHCGCSWSDKAPMSSKKTQNVTLVAYNKCLDGGTNW